MTLKLIKVRECDGVCCKESPRFPNKDKTDCIYHDQNGPKGCAIQRGDAVIPDGPSPINPALTGQEAFEQTCLPWPHDQKKGSNRHLIGCCWQWVE